jgi:hypothetical protein
MELNKSPTDDEERTGQPPKSGQQSVCCPSNAITGNE